MKKNDKKLSSGSLKRLRDFNWGDVRLYNYFKAIHDRQSRVLEFLKVSHYHKL